MLRVREHRAQECRQRQAASQQLVRHLPPHRYRAMSKDLSERGGTVRFGLQSTVREALNHPITRPSRRIAEVDIRLSKQEQRMYVWVRMRVA